MFHRCWRLHCTIQDDLYLPTLGGVYHLRGLLNMFERKLDDAMVDAEQALAL